MKIVCEKETLLDAVSKVGGAVGNSTIPALEGILFSAENGYLTLTGYNLELGITTAIAARVEQAGRVVLSAKYFSEIIRKLPDGSVSISCDEKLECIIKCSKARFKIIGLDSNEYPELPALSDGIAFDLPGQTLKSMIRQTRFSVAKSDEKPIYTGILFDFSEDMLTLVAVDGFRLAIRNEKVRNALNMKFVVPEKTLNEVSKLLDNDRDDLRISVGKRHIIFEIDSYLIISRLLDGEFIDYKTAVPKNSATQVIVQTREISTMIDRVALLISDRTKTYVKCIFEENEIKASCESAIGVAEDSIQADIQGERVEIGFNSLYLLEALKAAETDEIKIELGTSLSPIKIIPKNDEGFLFMVLPVRLKS